MGVEPTYYIRNCKIVGITYLIKQQGTSGGNENFRDNFENCEFLHCTGWFDKQSTTAWRNCTFRDYWRSNGKIIYAWYHNFIWENCTFARVGNYNEHLFTQEGACGIIFDGCVFTNCVQMSTAGASISLISVRAPTSSIRNCYFENNYQEVNPSDGNTYLLVGNSNSVGGQEQPFENCYFGYNRIVAPKNEVAGSFAIGIVGTSNYQRGMPIVNSTFLSNEVSYVASDLCEVTPSRGVIISATTSGNANQCATIANCTFQGPGDDIPDIAQYGGFITKNSYLINSIINRTGANANPFSLVAPSCFHIINSSLSNLETIPDGVSVSGLETAPVPLELIRDEKSGRKALRPTAVMAGLTNKTSDIAYNTKGTYRNSFRYRADASSVWTKLLANYNTNLASTDAATMLIGDAFGNPRTLGAFTRGAIQPLSERALSGRKLTVRADPVTAASFEGDTTQVLLVGEQSKPVTPTASPGCKFIGWYTDTDNAEPYSTEETLPAITITDDLVLIAKYEVPKVTVTFNLKESGTFAVNGLSTYTTNLLSGAVFPAPPQFTESNDYHFEGWEESFPDLVPYASAPLTFTARQVSKSWRNFFIVPTDEVPENSDKSGESWANATDDITAVYRDASRYRGRILLKHGIYTIPLRLAIKSNVHFIGSFDGTETGEVPSDPDKAKTIITGGGTVSAFATHDGQVTNAVFCNLTIKDFKDYAFYLCYSQNDLSRLTLKNTTIANTGQFGGGNSTIMIYGTIDFEETIITNCARAVWVQQNTEKGRPFTNRVHRSEFVANRSNNSSGSTSRSTMWLETYDPIEITESEFRNNTHQHYNDTVAMRLACAGYARIADTIFEGNYTRGNCSRIVYNSAKTTFIIEGCTFRGNYNDNGDHVGDAQSSGITLSGSGLTIIKDTLFTVNTNKLVDGITGCAINRSGSGKTIIQNCTFEDNVIKENTAGLTGSIIASTGDSNAKMAIVNCAFKGNVVPATTASSAQLYTTANDKGTFAIINTLIENDPLNAAKPVHYPAATHVPTVVTSAIENIDPVAYTNFNGNYVSGLMTGRVTYKGHTKTDPKHLTLSATSPYAKGGIPVYQGSDNLLYIHTPDVNAEKPYLELTSKLTRLTEEAADALSLKRIPDAQGTPRPLRRNTLGPIIAPAAPTRIIIR